MSSFGALSSPWNRKETEGDAGPHVEFTTEKKDMQALKLCIRLSF